MDHAEYAAAVAELRRQVVEYAALVWASVNLTDEGLRELVGLMAPAVVAAQESMAAMTSIYIAAATNTTEIPVAADIPSGRGVSAEKVYERPVITARAALARGKSVDAALQSGARRLQNIAGTDLQMAKVRQAQRSFEHGGVQFYRRVLTGSENCAMCMIAATQRYRRSELMPIHPGCDCDVDVIPPGMDLDSTLDVEALNATHESVKEFAGVADRGGRAVDYRKLIVTHEHGEVGPTLSWLGQKFTGPNL